MITIKGNLVLKEDYSVDEDLIVEGNITCEGGLWDIDALNINANNIYANNIDALNINYYAVCFSYYSIKCNSIKGRRNNSKHFCLDKEIEITKKVCETCGKEL